MTSMRMNRYMAIGIAADVLEGRQVLWVSEVRPRDDFEQFLEHVGGSLLHDAKICRTNGRERVEHPDGGSVSFRTGNNPGRGHTFDVAVLCGSKGHDENVLHAVAPALTTGKPVPGDLIRIP